MKIEVDTEGVSRNRQSGENRGRGGVRSAFFPAEGGS